MSTPSNSSSSTEASSDRVRLRRHAERGSYDSATVLEIFDEALISHVGVPTADGPIVLPMLHANDGETLYLHGAAANHLLKSGENTEICVTATLVDGLVIARSAFHHSMNYRSVVVRGRARTVTDTGEKTLALDLLVDRVGQGRSSDCRPPNRTELLATHVVAIALSEASAKVRTGDATDEADDLASPHWAGVVPVQTVMGEPVPNADLSPGLAVPDYLT
jgi:nitroimidazol reductase NimA-like FMN-containing flavoprotein (pyridoxamine 5'-phosphate oxidase superfamily)